MKKKYKERLKVWSLVLIAILFGIGLGSQLPIKKNLLLSQQSKTYQVTKVIDGDTIQVKMDSKIETVRLIGIDTPEVPNPYKPEGCFGKEAFQKNQGIFRE